MIAKFASVCPCCNVRTIPGVSEIRKGARGWQHVTCGGPTVTMARPAAPAYRARSASRGKWNGCSCGARELPGGGLSANACKQCRFDEYDC